MKIYLKLLFILTVLSSCSDQRRELEITTGINDSIASPSGMEPEQSMQVSHYLTAERIDFNEVSDKVFTISDLLGNDCSARIDCDCCGGFLVLKADSSFLHQDYCSPETFLSFGTYAVSDSNLVLNFSGKMKMKTMNEHSGDYALKDTTFKPAIEIYKAYLCRDVKVILNEKSERIIKCTVLSVKEKLTDIEKEFALASD